MIRLLTGDCRDMLATLPDASVHMCITSPPYYALRSYLDASHPDKHRELGSEATPDEYLATMVQVFREVRRVLRDDGTCWVNMGDSYASAPVGSFNGGGFKDKSAQTSGRDMSGVATSGTIDKVKASGLKPKDLLMMPARLALALQADGWWLRSDIIWAKPNPMPESVTDRPTNAHEHVFLLTKRSRYFYDADAVREEAEYGRREWSNNAGNMRRAVHSYDGDKPLKLPSATVSGGDPTAGRNLRNVWTIATAPFSEWTPQHEITQLPASEAQAPGAKGSAGGGGTARITSPDCPLHAGAPDRVPTGFYDGLSDAQLSRIRGNGSDPAQDSIGGSAATLHTLGQSQSLPSTTSCSDLAGARIATPNSTESHRTALGHLFSEHAISCEETADGRPRTPPSQCSPALTDRDTDESRSGGDSSLLRCEPERAADSSRTSASDGSCACRCGYYRKVTTKTSHFATFPPELAERCIRAGTSERGCCAQCGKPWVRVTEKKFRPLNTSIKAGHTGKHLDASMGWADERCGINDVTTTGWSPGCQCKSLRCVSCACDVPSLPEGVSDERQCPHCGSRTEWTTPATSPCVVLDCFSGAGTALLVADRLGRDAIGIDLSHAYVEMARDRLRQDCPLFADISPPPAEDPEDERMADLFAEAAE